LEAPRGVGSSWWWFHDGLWRNLGEHRMNGKAIAESCAFP
jgi:hypothetical protein